MSSQPQFDLNAWLTKSEVAQTLRVAEKTVDRMAIRGKLQKSTRERPGLPPVVVFHPSDVERERNARIAAIPPFAVPESAETTALATQTGHPSNMSNAGEALTALLRSAAAAVPLHEKLCLTEAEAIAYTGVGRTHLREKLKGELIGPNGARVYRRAALENWLRGEEN